MAGLEVDGGLDAVVLGLGEDDGAAVSAGGDGGVDGGGVINGFVAVGEDGAWFSFVEGTRGGVVRENGKHRQRNPWGLHDCEDLRGLTSSGGKIQFLSLPSGTNL